jgi:hypothetical protein
VAPEADATVEAVARLARECGQATRSPVGAIACEGCRGDSEARPPRVGGEVDRFPALVCRPTTPGGMTVGVQVARGARERWSGGREVPV